MYSYLLASFTLRSGHALHVKLDAYRPANNFVEAILLAVCKAHSAMKPNRAEMRWADMVDDNEATERTCESACKCVASGISVGLFSARLSEFSLSFAAVHSGAHLSVQPPRKHSARNYGRLDLHRQGKLYSTRSRQNVVVLRTGAEARPSNPLRASQSWARSAAKERPGVASSRKISVV